MDRPIPLPWYRQLVLRIATLWPLKALGTSAFMALFFWAYFSVMENPVGLPLIMPRLPLDQAIPFSTLAFPAYVSLWVYVSLPTALMSGFRSLLLQGTLGVAFRSFGENLYNDSAVVAPTPADTDGIRPQTTSTALSAGSSVSHSAHISRRARCWPTHRWGP